MNNRGDKGHPCLMPREVVKKGEGEPLTRMAKFADVIQPRIQFTPTIRTPDLKKNKSDEIPIEPIKCLSQI